MRAGGVAAGGWRTNWLRAVCKLGQLGAHHCCSLDACSCASLLLYVYCTVIAWWNYVCVTRLLRANPIMRLRCACARLPAAQRPRQRSRRLRLLLPAAQRRLLACEPAGILPASCAHRTAASRASAIQLRRCRRQQPAVQCSAVQQGPHVSAGTWCSQVHTHVRCSSPACAASAAPAAARAGLPQRATARAAVGTAACRLCAGSSRARMLAPTGSEQQRAAALANTRPCSLGVGLWLRLRSACNYSCDSTRSTRYWTNGARMTNV